MRYYQAGTYSHQPGENRVTNQLEAILAREIERQREYAHQQRLAMKPLIEFFTGVRIRYERDEHGNTTLGFVIDPVPETYVQLSARIARGDEP